MLLILLGSRLYIELDVVVTKIRVHRAAGSVHAHTAAGLASLTWRTAAAAARGSDALNHGRWALAVVQRFSCRGGGACVGGRGGRGPEGGL